MKSALSWQVARSAEEIIEWRERQMQQLEMEAQRLWATGVCMQWFEGADLDVVVVAHTVNGPMLECLCNKIGYEDAEVVQLFREGADLYGAMPKSSIGAKKPAIVTGDIDALAADRASSNARLQERLKEDPFADELHRLTLEDANMGKMSKPVPAEQCNLNSLRLCPRFGVQQGTREDGSVKSGRWATCPGAFHLNMVIIPSECRKNRASMAARQSQL